MALGTRALLLEIDGDDYSSAVSSVKVVSAESDSDFTSFADAAAGGSRKYSLQLTATQDVAADSLWRKVWDSAGDEVEVVVRPAGGTAASATTPTFTGTAIIAEPDGDFLGGDADKSATSRFTVDLEWEFLAKPVADYTP